MSTVETMTWKEIASSYEEFLELWELQTLGFTADLAVQAEWESKWQVHVRKRIGKFAASNYVAGELVYVLATADRDSDDFIDAYEEVMNSVKMGMDAFEIWVHLYAEMKKLQTISEEDRKNARNFLSVFR